MPKHPKLLNFEMDIDSRIFPLLLAIALLNLQKFVHLNNPDALKSPELIPLDCNHAQTKVVHFSLNNFALP